MRRVILSALVVTSTLPGWSADVSAQGRVADLPTIGVIERLHPSFDEVIPVGVDMRLLVDGHEWTEGPVWVPELDAILYSEIPSNTIYRWSETEGETPWLRPSGYTGETPRAGEQGSNGLAIGPDGSLLLAQHGDRRIAKLEADWHDPTPTFTTVADEYHGRRFSSPNDIAVLSNGDIYFTDPPYGLRGGDGEAGKELDVDGVYRLAADGSLTRVIDDLRRPNGIAFSPDEETLYVSAVGALMAYDVAPDGSLGSGRLFFETSGDGMAVDQQGRLYVTSGRRGVLVLDPDGTHLGTFVPGDRVSNVAFGGDGSTLYITGVQVVSVRLTVKGVWF
jgi:gluconolactonase